MTSLNTLIGVSLGYVAVLFVIAFVAERASLRGQTGWLNSPLIYTLSLSIYCTAWTFYGAVGYAARSGMEFVTIYLGPTLVMLAWWWILRKLVRIGRAQRVTSIADLISARYGKSNLLAILITVMAVLGVTPYIALQLQSVTLSVAAFAEEQSAFSQGTTAFWVAIGLAIFTVLFGTRGLNPGERHSGIVIAIAVEAVMKLVALLAVGIFVVWGISGGIGAVMERIDQSALNVWDVDRSRWAALTGLSAAAFLCLPRMFQVMVVENNDERHLQFASWAFPAYLFLMSLFVVPIAVTGLDRLPDGSNPDLYVLSLPLAEGREGLAVLAFLGGFSSATSMVIVATLALATMVSNHIVMPIWLRTSEQRAAISGDVRNVVIFARRISILFIIFFGYLYFRFSGEGTALAAIGLISFAGVAQFLPPILGALFWRGATGAGAVAGLMAGYLVWLYSSFLPSFGAGVILPLAVFESGPFGIGWLRPLALFGIEGLDPTVHAVVWSLTLNTFFFVLVSLFTFPTPLERLQGAQFVNVFDHSTAAHGWSAATATSEDLLIMTQRILGANEALALFRKAARAQDQSGGLPEPTPGFLESLERELGGSVGAATAHAMISQLAGGGAAISVQDLMAVADESAQILEYSGKLERQSAELMRTARQLREANEKLTELSEQKDAFLSQISHELRTPMTSIRSFSEILRDESGLDPDVQARYATIINDEALRLTRLLDELLDLSVLENGKASLNFQKTQLAWILNQAVLTARAANGPKLHIAHDRIDPELSIRTDRDRLCQVFINLITNAQKYCDADDPVLEISVTREEDRLAIRFADNGTPLPEDKLSVIFEKFVRIESGQGTGAGLGLAICKEIMSRLGGNITCERVLERNCFTVWVPEPHAMAAE